MEKRKQWNQEQKKITQDQGIATTQQLEDSMIRQVSTLVIENMNDKDNNNSFHHKKKKTRSRRTRNHKKLCKSLPPLYNALHCSNTTKQFCRQVFNQHVNNNNNNNNNDNNNKDKIHNDDDSFKTPRYHEPGWIMDRKNSLAQFYNTSFFQLSDGIISVSSVQETSLHLVPYTCSREQRLRELKQKFQCTAHVNPQPTPFASEQEQFHWQARELEKTGLYFGEVEQLKTNANAVYILNKDGVTEWEMVNEQLHNTPGNYMILTSKIFQDKLCEMFTYFPHFVTGTSSERVLLTGGKKAEIKYECVCIHEKGKPSAYLIVLNWLGFDQQIKE